jgi:hypothetical protein
MLLSFVLAFGSSILPALDRDLFRAAIESTMCNCCMGRQRIGDGSDSDGLAAAMAYVEARPPHEMRL